MMKETTIINNYYENNSPYDFYYSSRIRRFHRPYYSYGYYGIIIPIVIGINIHTIMETVFIIVMCGILYYYGGYGFYDPFYDYYSYYYTPYYYGGYYNYHHHGNYHGWNHTHTTNSTDYVFGHRGSFSGRNRHLTVKSNLKNSINNTTNTSTSIKPQQ